MGGLQIPLEHVLLLAATLFSCHAELSGTGLRSRRGQMGAG